MARMSDLALMLAEKEGIDQSQASLFIEKFFAQIALSLPSERLVKIAGLGTFKIQQVKARESVSVNTGERLVIESHDRISFVPEKSLRDAVNKPFAAFQTVEVNSGVDFSAIDAAMSTAATDEDEVEDETESASETVSVKQDEPQSTEAPQTPTNPETISEEDQSTENAESTNNTDNGISEADDGSVSREYLEERLNQSKNRLRCWIVGATLVMLVVGIAGFFLGRQIAINSERSSTSQQALISTLHDELAKARKELNSLTADSVAIASKDSVRKEKQVKQSDKGKAGQKALETAPPTPVKYGENDPQVRHGAYKILGIDKTVKARKGQTLSSISKANFGPGMECYVKAVNPGVSEVKAGQEVNLPKLKLKKLKR